MKQGEKLGWGWGQFNQYGGQSGPDEGENKFIIHFETTFPKWIEIYQLRFEKLEKDFFSSNIRSWHLSLIYLFACLLHFRANESAL